MPEHDRAQTTLAYQGLLANPMQCLQQDDLVVNALPGVADATASNLYFAYGTNGIAIDTGQVMAAALANTHNDGALQRQMLVSVMRSNALAVGVGGRHQPTQQTAPTCDLWVTEMQSGCSVLILDWGGNQYSMIHLQPSNDNQFNRVGKAIVGASNVTLAGYKNTWLKSELTTIVGNTGGQPQYYILIQSMFDASRGTPVQVIGVRQNNRFEFYRQKQAGGGRTVEHLEWNGWYTYVPYRSY